MQVTPRGFGVIALLLAIELSLPSRLPAQQQDPRPAENPSARPTQDLPVRAGLPVNNGEGQPSRLPGQDSPASADRPFDTWTMALPYRRGVTIWARNPSADTVTITNITLADCLNLATPCGPTDLNLVLGQGDSAEAITIRPKIWDDQFTYRVSWKWMFPATVIPTGAGAGDGPALPFAVWGQTSEERHEVAVMAKNTSSDTVIISRVRLSDCKNIGINCDSVRLNLRIAPGDSASTIILRPERWGEPLGFHADWEWNWSTGSH